LEATAFYTVPETAIYLGVNVSQVYALVKSEGFPCKKIGRHYRIHKAKLYEWATSFGN